MRRNFIFLIICFFSFTLFTCAEPKAIDSNVPNANQTLEETIQQFSFFYPDGDSQDHITQSFPIQPPPTFSNLHKIEYLVDNDEYGTVSNDNFQLTI